QVDVAGKLAMLFLGNAAGNEDAEVTEARMDGVYDGLAIGANFVDVLVKVENPSERLLRRRDVVALRAEHDGGRADIAEVDRGAIRCLDSSRGEIVADEQLIDDELDLLGVQIDVTSPPALETQIARRLGVDLEIEIVLLGPQRIRGVLVLEILHQPGAVELAVAEIAGERGQPAAAEQSAAVAHGVLAVHAGPVRQGRSGDDDGAKELRADGGEHHDRPSRLAIADHAGLSASGWSAATFSRKTASARAISSMVWPGMGSGRKPMK